MVIRVYRNMSDDVVVTKNITELATFDGSLRDGCSVIEPVIRFENLNKALVNQINYVKIEEFGRYYFVRDIRFIGNLVEVVMYCDVLSSWQTQLKSLDAVVSRQENEFNLYLQDGLFRTYQNMNYQIVQFPNRFDTYQYVLAVAG